MNRTRPLLPIRRLAGILAALLAVTAAASLAFTEAASAQTAFQADVTATGGVPLEPWRLL